MTVDCAVCGEVAHLPIVEDESHCACVALGTTGYTLDNTGVWVACECGCHGWERG